MKKIGLLFFIIGSGISSYGQGFGAEVLVGANFSQVDGDQLAGYNKLGLNAGVQINREINNMWEGAFEIRYSMKGAKEVIDPEVPSLTDLRLNYHYLEIPVLAKYQGLEKINLYAGPSIGLNVFNQRDELGRKSEEEELNPIEFAFHLGGTYYFTETLGLDLRHSYSLFSVRDFPLMANSLTAFGRAGWYNRLFTVGINYRPKR